jgi:AraC-like DNA-binding protein
LHAAIRLTITLVEELHHASQLDWPEHVQCFTACIRTTGLRDRRVVTALLEIVREEMRRFCDIDERSAASPGTIEDMLADLEDRVRLNATDSKALSGRAARVRRVATFIEQHYAEPLTLERLASVVGWHRASLATEFRRETGLTVHDFLTQVRIRRATDLLRRGDKIEPVIMLVGYRGKKNFYRHFKRQLGMTPGEFKEKEQQLRGIGV